MGKYVIAKYIRLSIEDARSESLSIENQRLLLDKYISKNIQGISGGQVPEVLEFIDNGHTGTNMERPSLQEMLNLVQARKLNCIIIKDLSRFSRNMLEAGYYIEQMFPLYGVRFISVTDNFDTMEHEGGIGGIEVAFKFLLHEQYSKDLSKKVKSAKLAKAIRGEYVSKNCVFGFKKVGNRLEIDNIAAETVRLIFEMYADGKSEREIAERLRKDHRPTPSEYKKRIAEPNCIWRMDSIKKVLQDEQYIGTYIAGKTRNLDIGSKKILQVPESEWIRIPRHHPGIVSEELFETCRERRVSLR